MPVERLAIGTAQFGSDYGISNRNGCVSDAEMQAIIDRCRQTGINMFDTAAAYGDAESRLGEMLPANWHPRIVTKLQPRSVDPETIRASIRESTRNLGRKPVYGFLVHRANDLLGGHGKNIWRTLEEYQDAGNVERIGVSVYQAEQVAQLLDRFPLQIVQVPASMVDQRLIADRTLDRLKEADVEVHVRSIFLQGLLFLNAEELPSNLAFARSALERVQVNLREAGVSVLEAALGFALGRPEFDAVLLGVTTCDELDAIVDVASSSPLDLDWSSFALSDLRVLDPSQWNAMPT